MRTLVLFAPKIPVPPAVAAEYSPALRAADAVTPSDSDSVPPAANTTKSHCNERHASLVTV